MEWSVLLIDNSNRRYAKFGVILGKHMQCYYPCISNLFCPTNTFGSGSMEFVVPQADSSAFFPISVRFMATDTFGDLKVCLNFLFFA